MMRMRSEKYYTVFEYKRLIRKLKRARFNWRKLGFNETAQVFFFGYSQRLYEIGGAV